MKLAFLFLLITLSQKGFATDHGVVIVGDLGMFQQQVKSEVGDESSKPLVDENNLTLAARYTYGHEGLGWGLFFRLDSGDRKAGSYKGLDDEEQTLVEGRLGGHYREVWVGPHLQYRVAPFFVGAGHGSFAWRKDSGRSDVADKDGETSKDLRVLPKVAWLAYGGFEAALPIQGVRLVSQLEYRIRYYDRRGTKTLQGGIVHGTQDLGILIGARIEI